MHKKLCIDGCAVDELITEGSSKERPCKEGVR